MALAKSLPLTCTGELALLLAMPLFMALTMSIGYVIDYAIGHIIEKVKTLFLNWKFCSLQN